MTEYTSPMHTVPHFPEDLTLPQFLFDYQHPIRLHRESGIPWLVDAVTGKAVLQDELIARVWDLANGLSYQFGIDQDDTVGVISANHLDFPVTIWAAHRLGASVFTVNPTYTVDELVPHLTDMKPSLLMVHASALETVRQAAEQIGLAPVKIVLFNTSPASLPTGSSLLTLQDLVDLGHSNKATHQFAEFKLQPGQGKMKVALYFPSSGTTGVPKMVAIPHLAFISNIIQTAAHDAGIDMSVPVVERRFRPGDVSCAVLPFFHIFGLLINVKPFYRYSDNHINISVLRPKLHYMLFSGMTVVIMPKFDFVAYLATIKRYRVTNLSLVPPMLTLFCKHPAVRDADLSSLRVVFVGGAPMSVHLAKAMGKVVPQAVIEQGYGMTELTGILTMPPLNRRVATDAVGHLLPGFTARVLKSDGSLAGVGESGELYVTGPSLAIHYVNNQQISKETFVDGWVRSGDEVYFDENQELHIVDRIKDFIKVGGFQVAPAELEARLVTNPDITDCCVVPVPHDFNGQVPRAYAVLSRAASERIRQNPEEKEMIKAALIKDIEINKAKYKRLVGGVEFVDAIPKTSSGKLLRRALHDESPVSLHP
ncbi:amp dependent CoA ligase [Mycena crocata]|nr:amp dependent CoA ligase [Mycena crocata]